MMDEEKLARVRALAAIAAVPIPEALAPEVADRFACVLGELEQLTDLDLQGIEPIPVFPEDTDDGK